MKKGEGLVRDVNFFQVCYNMNTNCWRGIEAIKTFSLGLSWCNCIEMHNHMNISLLPFVGCRELTGIRAVGTDGGEALKKGFR